MLVTFSSRTSLGPAPKPQPWVPWTLVLLGFLLVSIASLDRERYNHSLGRTLLVQLPEAESHPLSVDAAVEPLCPKWSATYHLFVWPACSFQATVILSRCLPPVLSIRLVCESSLLGTSTLAVACVSSSLPRWSLSCFLPASIACFQSSSVLRLTGRSFSHPLCVLPYAFVVESR